MLKRNQAPPITSFKNVRFDPPQPTRLANGIETWIVGDGDDGICRVSLYVTGGVVHDVKPLLSTIVSDSIFEGAGNLTATQIAETFDYCGATKQVCPYDECCEITVVALNENLEKVLSMLTQCLSRPTFPEKEIGVIKTRLKSNLSILRQRVKFLAQVESYKLYFGENHPLAVEAKPDDIDTISCYDIREFHAKYYHPANCRIIVSGRVTDRELEILNRTIGAWNTIGDKTKPWQWYKEPADDKFRIVDKPDAVQAALHMMQPVGILRYHPDYAKLRLLMTAFGGYFGSRLMQNIREDKGYTYGIYASLSGRRNDAYLSITTECDCRYVKPILKEIEMEIERLHNEPISDEELEKVRQHALSDQVKTLDTPFSRGQYVASMLLYGIDTQYFSRQIDAIQHTSASELQRIARQYLNFDDFKQVVAGDANKV